MVTITPTESAAINRLRFLCLLGVVMIHCAVFRQPAAIAQAPGETLQSALHWHLLFTGIPNLKILFILSGYLFFRHVNDTWDWRSDYLSKIGKRLSGLLLPYMIWGGVYTALNILQSHLSWSDITPSYLLNAFWPLDPLTYPMCGVFWFMRCLICFTLLSPLYYLVYRYCRHFTLFLAAALILSPLPIHYIYLNGYLLLGGYLAYSGITLTRLSELLEPKLAFCGALALTTFTCFFPEQVPLPSEVRSTLRLLLWLPALVGLCSKICLPSWCTPAAGMFLYATHFFVCSKIGSQLVQHLPLTLPFMIAEMWLSMILATAICLIAYAILRKIPMMSYLLTGGR